MTSCSQQISYFKMYWPYIFGGIFCYVIGRSIFGFLAMARSKLTTSDLKQMNYDEMEIEGSLNSLIHKEVTYTPLVHKKIAVEDSLKLSDEFYKLMKQRRTVSCFSDEKIPKKIICNLIKTAGTAPSGAHSEPWTFVLVSEINLKQQIRAIIETEEENMVKPSEKVYLTEAPYLILVFRQIFTMVNGVRINFYYNEMSVAISTGILLSAIHYAGLVTSTSTPLNSASSIARLLNRPDNEELMILLPVGYPSDKCLVPKIQRKKLNDILIEY